MFKNGYLCCTNTVPLNRFDDDFNRMFKIFREAVQNVATKTETRLVRKLSANVFSSDHTHWPQYDCSRRLLTSLAISKSSENAFAHTSLKTKSIKEQVAKYQ
jgi:hypothetical protein